VREQGTRRYVPESVLRACGVDGSVALRFEQEASL
jgi:hypothetical protein